MEKKEKKGIILSDTNAWCRVKSQKAKQRKKIAFLAHKHIFFPPPFLLILSGNWDKLESFSPLLLLQHFYLSDVIYVRAAQPMMLLPKGRSHPCFFKCKRGDFLLILPFGVQMCPPTQRHTHTCFLQQILPPLCTSLTWES